MSNPKPKKPVKKLKLSKEWKEKMDKVIYDPDAAAGLDVSDLQQIIRLMAIEVREVRIAQGTMVDSEKTCAFDALFTRYVPHILENIFFSLDYKSFKRCKEVNKAWRELLSSEQYQKKSREIFHQEMLIEKEEDEMKLLNASKAGNAEEVRRLLSKHVDANFVVGGSTLLNAVAWGHNDVVKLLLDAGADVDEQICFGRTSLWWAAAGGNKDMTILLLDAGARINVADKGGVTPLHEAVSLHDIGMVQLLIERGALPNAVDIYGRTPLH